ncbi:MAG: OmpA family protein [Candidatus Atribacteria bacterium]|nr:OmpA family protein [Candidatus Atribacteria bacterium]
MRKIIGFIWFTSLCLFLVLILMVNAVAADQPLTSFFSGAFLVDKPSEYSSAWASVFIIDEDPEAGWCSTLGQITDNVFVIELAEETVLHYLEFDTGNVDTEGSAARDILIELSNEGPENGFQEISSISLIDQQDNQNFPVTVDHSGRWLRLTILNNHGSPEYTELMDFRAFGEQLTKTSLPDVSGTYETNYNDFHLLQQGTSVTGCYEWDEGVLNGGIEGRIMKFTWIEPGQRGPAIMVFTSDGEKFFGLWWYEGDTTASGEWNGVKKSQEVGRCPHWAGGIREQITKELLESGRVRLYGINFDYDSDVILVESKPTLDKIADMLKSESSMQLIIEGHTDSDGSEDHNLVLSQKRAESVKFYLVQSGIHPSRLSVEGYGESQPVASNKTPTGKAQNRRVELVVKN